MYKQKCTKIILALFEIIRGPITMIPGFISMLADVSVSFKRVSKFLQAEELDVAAVQRLPHDPEAKFDVEIKGTFSWDDSTNTHTLKDINLQIPRGQLVAVVGSVGSGKSSLLSSILGDMYKIDGKVVVRGKTAYIAQQAWIQNATLRDNVLFGSQFNPELYSSTMDVCQLIAGTNTCITFLKLG
jgi:ABC-type multidrug transport system fused ATPase/permease subunit